jgi:copper transport protein
VLTALGELAAAGSSPGGLGVLARRTLRTEAVAMLAVFGVSAALVTYAPPIDTASGPYSASVTLGPALLELTVEPARTGPNTVHMYLIDARTGVPFTQTRELAVSARLPGRQIGPIPLHAEVAGPGHYIVPSAPLTPGGAWKLQVTDRVSEFQEYTRTVKVPIQ